MTHTPLPDYVQNAEENENLIAYLREQESVYDTLISEGDDDEAIQYQREYLDFLVSELMDI
jgi:L-lysine 2,3-aminomutase